MEKKNIVIAQLKKLWDDKYIKNTCVYRVTDASGAVYLLKYSITKEDIAFKATMGHSLDTFIDFDLHKGDEVEINILGTKEFNGETQIKCSATSNDVKRILDKKDKVAEIERKNEIARKKFDAEMAKKKADEEAAKERARNLIHTDEVNGKKIKYKVLDSYENTNSYSTYARGMDTIEVVNPDEISFDDVRDWYATDILHSVTKDPNKDNIYYLRWSND